MNRILAASAVMISALYLSACTSNSHSVIASDIQHHRFILTSINGQSITATSKPFLEIGEKLFINGKMCNDFFGHAYLDQNIIKSSTLVMTKMMCKDPQLNQLDRVINQFFTNGATISLHNNILQLKNQNNTLNFLLKDWM